MKIIRGRYCDWDGTTKRKLKRATMPGGCLRRFMQAFPQSPTILVLGNKHLKGWAFAFRHDGCTDLFLFVNGRYRNRGVATLLAQEVLKDFPTIALGAWNDQTRKFFGKLQSDNPSRISVYDWWKRMDRYLALIRSARTL